MGRNKKTFLNIIFTLVVFIFAITFMILIRSLDNYRFQVESLTKKIEQSNNKLDELQNSLKAGNFNKKEYAPQLIDNKTDTTISNRRYFDPNAVAGGKLVTSEAAATKNLNYLINNEAFAGELWGHTSSTLAVRDYEHPEKFMPLLAEKWELADDKLVYDITLRQGVLWHDFKDPVTGKEWKDVEVTADDFKFYIDVIKNKDVDCAPLRVYYQDISKVEILSKYHFKVFWSKKYYLSEEQTLGLLPLPRHFYKSYEGPFDGKKFNNDYERNKMIISCGPYSFDSWEAGQKVVLKRWGKYFGNKYGIGPALDELSFEVIGHPNTRFQALLSGDIDRTGLTGEQWTTKINIPEFDPESSQFKFKKIKYPSRAYSYIGYTQKNPLFQDKKVRTAFTHLIDREKILKIACFGLGRVVSGPFFVDSLYYDKSITPYPFSIEKAKKLLKEAGWEDHDGDGILDKNGKKFEFTALVVSNSSVQEKMFPIIQEDMKKAGIEMNISKVEWSVYVQRLEKKQFDVVCLAWALPIEGDPYQVWHSSMADVEGSSNHISFKNKKADEIIEKLRVTFDMNERVKLCHEFHKLLHEEQPYTFLFCNDTLMAIRKDYKNVRLFPAYPAVPGDIMWLPE